MSGDPPPGIFQVALAVRVAASRTVTVPSSRLLMYIEVASREG